MRVGLTDVSFPFLARLSPTARRELDALPTSRARAKSHLLQRGDAVNGVFLVVTGALRVYYIAAEGREATLYGVEPGGTCMLALSATFNEEPYPAWVDAGRDGASYVRVPTDLFRSLLASEPAFREFMFGALSGRLFELMRTLEEAGSLVLEQRVARFLVRRADATGELRMTQVGIASELGTAREVVSRALRTLAARGLLKTGRQRIRLSNVRALRAFAAGSGS